MPIYIASGSFTDESSGIKYRFLVLPRYDIDLQKIIAKTKVLDLKNVLVLAVQILDVLEYLHNQGYTHSDIKSSNLMLGFDGARIGKIPAIKCTPSFQKDTKEVAVLSGKHRRAKLSKSRSSNYYDDEDFVIKDYKSPGSSDEEPNKKLVNVKNKFRKILSDKDSRTLHRHHAFNLRQLSSYVNYEDLNSSICSDHSYQKLLDDFGNKSLIRTTKEFRERKRVSSDKTESETPQDDINKEAILSQSNKQIYLLDYGLASKFLDSKGKHKDFGMDARKAHDGTLEYSSRDSHIGAHSRRSDLETLGYNILDWLTGSLPWKTTEVLAEPDLVHALKKNFMSDIKLLLKTCFKTEFYPQFVEKYFEYIISLEFTEKPNYEYCKNLFKSELLKYGNFEKEVSLNFSEPPKSPMSRKISYSKKFGKKNTPPNFLARNGIKKSYERENMFSLENDLKLELIKQTMNLSREGIRKPCASRNFFISDADLVARLKKSLMPHDIFGKKLSSKNLRSKKKTVQNRRGVRHRNSVGKFGNFMGSARQFTWAEILAGNPEDIIRAKERNTTATNEVFDDDSTCKYRIRKMSDASSESSLSTQSPLTQKDYLQDKNPTYAMKEVLALFKKKLAGKTSKDPDENNNKFEGYTPEMIRIHRIKEKREAKEKLEALKQQCQVDKEVGVRQRNTRSTRNKVKITEPSSMVTRLKASLETQLIAARVTKSKEVSKSKNNNDVKKIVTKDVIEEMTENIKPTAKAS